MKVRWLRSIWRREGPRYIQVVGSDSPHLLTASSQSDSATPYWASMHLKFQQVVDSSLNRLYYYQPCQAIALVVSSLTLKVSEFCFTQNTVSGCKRMGITRNWVTIQLYNVKKKKVERIAGK